MKDASNGISHKTAGSASMREPPEFISTHPSYDNRLSNFEEWMPEAMEKFSADDGLKCRHVREEMRLARKNAAELARKKEMRARHEPKFDPFRDNDKPEFRW